MLYYNRNVYEREREREREREFVCDECGLWRILFVVRIVSSR